MGESTCELYSVLNTQMLNIFKIFRAVTGNVVPVTLANVKYLSSALREFGQDNHLFKQKFISPLILRSSLPIHYDLVFSTLFQSSILCLIILENIPETLLFIE